MSKSPDNNKNEPAATVMAAMQETVERYGSLPALKRKVDGVWQTTAWNEYYAQVHLVARAFMALGLQPGQTITIIGQNSPEWFIGYLAAIFAGGVPTGIYTTSSPDQCQYIAEKSGAILAIVENAFQLSKFKAIRKNLPALKAIVLMTGADDGDDIYSWADLTKLAAYIPETNLADRIRAQKPEDLCSLIYTSGTTGDYKGVMISHDNLTWTAKAVSKAVKGDFNERIISYLPLSHIAEQIISLHAPIALGACSWFAESLETLGNTLLEVRPTIFVGVPRVWEKIQAKMIAAGLKNPAWKKKITRWARKIGLLGGYAHQSGKPKPWLYFIANRLVFLKAKKLLGLDQSRLNITTAAPISQDTLDFFLSLDLPLCEIYGMSECTGPATISLPECYKTGKAGFALPETTIKIAEDGEILIQGRNVFIGYFKNEAATKETLDEAGWLHSGDIGQLDSDGFLKITDRKKNLIITSGGENIAPQGIEEKLSVIPAIAQSLVIGDKRKYLTAIFTLNSEILAAEALLAGSFATDLASAATCPKFRAYIQKQVEAVNKSLAHVQTIKRFIIIPKEFTIDDGELTATMKIKRRVIYQKYAAEIESMYR